MRLAGFGVEPLADDAAVTDDDAANHGVRAGVTGRLARQFHAPPHVFTVHVARLSLAPHDGREPAAASAPGHEAGEGRRGRGGGAEGARGQLGVRHEPGSHGQRSEQQGPIQWKLRGVRVRQAPLSVRGDWLGLDGSVADTNYLVSAQPGCL